MLKYLSFLWHGGGLEFESHLVHYLLPITQLRFALMRGKALKIIPKRDKWFRMNSMQSERHPLRRVKLSVIVFLACSIVLPFITLIVPESEIPASTGPWFSWLLMIMMPISILLIYASYRFFGKRGGLDNFTSGALLMYIFGTTPSTYGTIIGFTDSALRYIAIPLGLVFSLVGLGFAFRLLPNLWDNTSKPSISE